MSKKIIGITVGTQLPKPNFDQTDPTKGDYIKGDRSFLRAIKTINGVEPDNNGDIAIVTDDTMTQAGVAADAKATGDAISAINALVGDTTVSSQISDAVADVVRTSDVITDAEIDLICGGVSLEFNDILVDETTGTIYRVYVEDGNLKMTEVG